MHHQLQQHLQFFPHLSSFSTRLSILYLLRRSLLQMEHHYL
jgi:hypothetical protein